MMSFIVPFSFGLCALGAYWLGYWRGRQIGLKAPVFRPVRAVPADEPTGPTISRASFQRMPGTDLGRRTGRPREREQH